VTVIESGKPDYTALDLPSPPQDRPYVIINMVTSADGKAVIEGTERGLGSTTDQRLMRELRVNADVVINGAGTLRASGTSSRVGDTALEELRLSRGKTRHPIASVLTGSGNLPLERLFFTARDFEAVIYVSTAAPAERVEAIRATGREVVAVDGGDEVRAMLRHMRQQLGAELLLVEGGPSLNGHLIALGCVDEYFLTVGPVIVGGDGGLTPVTTDRAPSIDTTTRLQLVSAFANPETSELYLRYGVAGLGAVAH
jgi:riboflavin biosynthesis pyrimidine reductase